MSRATAPDAARRLLVYNGGFLNARIRRILSLAGWHVTTGLPRPDDHVGVWGRAGTAYRGEAVARRWGAPILRVEDAFLRSLHPGRGGEPPMGLLLDRRGVHFDSSAPSDLEHLLATHPLDDAALIDRAREAIARIRRAHLTKYSAVDPDLPVPEPGYVLVIDQTRGDASIRFGGATADDFAAMLARARADHPGARIVVKTHPETRAGHRPGHFGPADTDARISLLTAPVSPWVLMDGAVTVHTVTSQLGFEAILAGHRPRVFGQPFYAGWGLTEDEKPVARRTRRLSSAQLFAAAMILAPTWHDPHRDRLAALEDVIDALEAGARAWREDRRGAVLSGMRLWKRRPLARFFGQHGTLSFRDDPAAASRLAKAKDRPLLVWAGRETPGHAAPDLRRVEDGFIRSRGLGAELVPPLSLVSDDLGIYYDPSRPSRLETLIAESGTLTPGQLRRAERLMTALKEASVTKYNTGSRTLPELPRGHRILVPGQVEDDMSILLGASGIAINAALLARVRADNPRAVLLWKPHPDVLAGLRAGAIDAGDADMEVAGLDPGALLGAVDEVWTMTSALGFEALIRQVPVTCLGAPFYAGWGLTRDLGPVPARRRARPGLAALVHAALIAYPRYVDPKTGLPCPPEIVVERLIAGEASGRQPVNRLLSKLQGLLASRAGWWR